MLTSEQNNKVLKNLNDKFLETMNDRVILATYLMSLPSKITNPEYTSQFKLVKDANSNRVNDLLIYNTKPTTLLSNLLTFRDTDKKFESKADLLKMITNQNYYVDLASLSDIKLMYEIAKGMHLDIKISGNKRTRDRTLIRLLKSYAIMDSGISTIILSQIPSEVCDRLMLLLQEKQAGNNSDLKNQATNAIIDIFLECKCISKKQHKQILVKCNLSHAKEK